MNLYMQDYMKNPSADDWELYHKIQAMEREGLPVGKRNLYYEYPESIRHFHSLFPNNHIDLIDWQKRIGGINQDFIELINRPETNERSVLNFINHKPAFYLIASLLRRTNFGHHEAYVMPEFMISGGDYKADYLLIGSNSGGYEFLFVELESPNKKSTLQSGHDALSTRSGLNQIDDWKTAIVADFSLLEREFEKYTNKKLPDEFHRCDTTRYHYAVISGRREDYNDVSYTERRRKAQERDIEIYHYDNICDLANDLESAKSF